MNGLPGYYGQPYGGIDQNVAAAKYNQDDGGMDLIDPGAMDGASIGPPQTLRQIISHNEELLRRRNNFGSNFRPPSQNPQHGRRASMLEFGVSDTGDLDDFQFDPNPNGADPGMATAMTAMLPPSKHPDPRKVRSREDLSLNTRFAQNLAFGPMSAVNTYSPVQMPNSGTTVEPSPSYQSGMMDMSMDFDPSIAMHSTTMQDPIYTTSPVAQSFNVSYMPTNHDPGGGATISPHVPSPITIGPHMPSVVQPQFQQPPQHPRKSTPSVATLQTMTSGSSLSMTTPSPVPKPASRRHSADVMMDFPPDVDMSVDQLGPMQLGMPAVQSIQNSLSMPQAKFANAYSQSGFDMLGVLMRVATRRRPQINIGPVDLSCAFVVCDIEKYDLPIVYCSEMFERLTGYTKYEILGRNCRFLQAPDGKVQSGVKRKYVDDSSVFYLKDQINKRSEAQLSLINYRKGGQPFMNLLTMIPIPFDTDEYKFYVGFQVDLVEHPGSISSKNPDGSYSINYNRSALPAYALPPPPDPAASLQDIGQTVTRDEVSQVLSTIGRGESELSKRVWDKILLENTDDVVHVLSLKGLFLYLSPASRKVLEYEPGELVGTALSAVCHPSDIVPVTRELKDSSSGAPVNVVYRIRRKYSGYTWFEAHGCLHTEQGKGRKCIILVGRERPVYALSRAEIINDATLGESELWTKLSTSGMFLYVSSTSRVMLDRLAEDLVGTSFQALMRPESKKEFLRLLDMARTGEKNTFRHDLQNRRGQVLHAQTTIYPGDARPGSKPTFLLAQTRLLKMTRAVMLQKHNSSESTKTDSASMGSRTPSTHISRQAMTASGNTSTVMSQGATNTGGILTLAGTHGLSLGVQDEALASEENIFDELKTTRSTSWQFELRQMERQNRLLAEELQGLLSRRKKRKRRKGMGQLEKDCANCHTRVTPEWRRGPSGQRDLCNSCGLRWAKQNGRVSPRKSSGQSDRGSTSPQFQGGVDGKSNKSPAHKDEAAAGDDGDRRGTMPPTIDEGKEPPHPNVLPA